MNKDIPGGMFNPRYPLFDLQIVNFAPANEREKEPHGGGSQRYGSQGRRRDGSFGSSKSSKKASQKNRAKQIL